VSNAITNGIRVTVSSNYIPAQSAPKARRYVFAYTVRIANEGTESAQLKSRHWIITDGNGKVEEVRGPGVVGEQPMIRPGEHFEYTSGCVLETPRGSMEGTYQMAPSGCVLETPRGSMEGTYQMARADGSEFDANIAPFALSLPYTLN
jgi:ApaG protein